MSRLDKLKEQHPDLNISLIDIIVALDPTDTYKYTEFLIKSFKSDSQYYSPEEHEFKGYLGVFLFGSGEIEVLNEFERHSRANRIGIKDISKYKNFLELSEQVKIAEETEKRKKLEKEILKIHEDDTWLILTPLSFEASKVYGSSTKWCTTQERYWERYLTTHRLVYCINKKTDTKVAFSRDFSTNNFQAWNTEDKEVNPMFIDFIPDDVFLKIRKELQRNFTTGDLIKVGKVSKNVTISDITRIADGETVNVNTSNLVDRLRRLMGIDSETTVGVRRDNEFDLGGSPVVRRRISDYPQINQPDLSNYLTYFNDPLPSLVTEDDVRPIKSFTGGTINY